MTINDGKGIFDKYGMLDEIKKRLEILADAKGVFRCGLIWDINDMVKAVEEGLRKDDEANAAKIVEFKRMNSATAANTSAKS